MRYILWVVALLETLEVFNRQEIRGFNSTLIKGCPEKIKKKKPATNFVLIAVSVKVALEITKELNIAF